MSPTYIKKLGFKAQKTNIGAQNIVGSTFEIFGIVVADFQVEDKGGKPRFFQKTFLVPETKFELVLGIPFLKISNADVSFGETTIMKKSYTTNKALPTTAWVQLVDSKEFIIAVLDADSETFVVYVAIQKREEMPVHLEKWAQI